MSSLAGEPVLIIASANPLWGRAAPIGRRTGFDYWINQSPVGGGWTVPIGRRTGFDYWIHQSPVRLDHNCVEVLDAILHICGHGVAGPQRQLVHNHTLAIINLLTTCTL